MREYGHCSVDGCTKKANYKSEMLCQMHYFRRMRNGSFELRQTKYQKNGFYQHAGGYKVLMIPGHPLAQNDGSIFEHRVVVFGLVGWNIPPCSFCGADSDWFSRKTHIDHIDKDRSNNAPENLRVLCNPCNTGRTKRDFSSYEHCGAVTVNGVTKTPTEWSREDGVNVTGATIERRISVGYTHYDAVYGEKKTHNGNKKKKPPTPPKHTRKNAIKITIDNLTMTAEEWSRQSDCLVSSRTVVNRFKSGRPHYNCVFDPPRSGYQHDTH